MFFLLRPLFEQWRHRSDHPFSQLPAFWCWDQGVFGRGLGQDGALSLPGLDPTALHPLCPTGLLSAQFGGQVWRGSPANQVQGECHSQTWLGEEVSLKLRLSPCFWIVNWKPVGLFFCQTYIIHRMIKHAILNWTYFTYMTSLVCIYYYSPPTVLNIIYSKNKLWVWKSIWTSYDCCHILYIVYYTISAKRGVGCTCQYCCHRGGCTWYGKVSQQKIVLWLFSQCISLHLSTDVSRVYSLVTLVTPSITGW